MKKGPHRFSQVRSSSSFSGFTLMEVIVVTAIFAVLSSFVFSAAIRAKGKAKESHCLLNLSQVGRGLGLYMADFDDVFPHAIDPIDRIRPEIWNAHPDFQARIPFMPYLHEVVQPYVRSREVFQCPADNGLQVVDDQFPTEFVGLPSMFDAHSTSYFFRTEIAFRLLSNSSFQLPSNINVLFDGAGHWHGSTRGLRPNDLVEVADMLLVCPHS